MDALRFIGAVTREVRSIEKDGRPARVGVAACSPRHYPMAARSFGWSTPFRLTTIGINMGPGFRRRRRKRRSCGRRG